MKLHYIKILLFETIHNNTSYTNIYITTVKSSNYDKDTGMKSVMQQFADRTSQRFQEYEERMKDKRQKYKQQRDKNIQKIIEEDKREKSLAEKVEKGCLKCGCALGGGVLPVWGLVSGLWYETLSQYVSTTLVKEATDAGIIKGIEVGLVKVREIVSPSITGHRGFTKPTIRELETLITGKFTDGVSLHDIIKCISSNVEGLGNANDHPIFFATVKTMARQTPTEFNRGNNLQAATEVTKAVDQAYTGIMEKGVNATSSLTTGITASIVAIVVIVLVMVIIYLILRYRRKKKKNKKAQYTKLLNQ
nr:rifin PIR protein, putative [Plasmodium sp. DRC-Itaito]